MNRKILFVCEEKNFLISSMIKALEDALFDVIPVQPDIVEIQLIEKKPDIYIVYLEGDVNTFDGTLKYIKKLVTEEGKDRIAYLIGTPAEINLAHEIIPKAVVSASFSRPVNMNDIISKLNNLIIDEDNSSGRKRILVVDDDGMTLRTMNNWLRDKYEVYMANSGINAISFLTNNKADLILLDYEMPGASGLQIFEMLKGSENTKDIPVIFLTSKDDKETVMKVLASKPEKYLLKTLEKDELVKSIDDFFKGK
ncbi:MAG: response regulator [Treponema sp.]|nr:response regulator [Treponema sp.]